MEKEFNLSDKQLWGTSYHGDLKDGGIYRETDVKEFIKRLKEEIDKLAGEKLV